MSAVLIVAGIIAIGCAVIVWAACKVADHDQDDWS